MKMDQVICTSTNYVIYSLQMDQVICTYTYVELNFMQMDRVICIILYLFSADMSSHLHCYKSGKIFYAVGSSYVHLYIC